MISGLPSQHRAWNGHGLHLVQVLQVPESEVDRWADDQRQVLAAVRPEPPEVPEGLGRERGNQLRHVLRNRQNFGRPRPVWVSQVQVEKLFRTLEHFDPLFTSCFFVSILPSLNLRRIKCNLRTLASSWITYNCLRLLFLLVPICGLAIDCVSKVLRLIAGIEKGFILGHAYCVAETEYLADKARP